MQEKAEVGATEPYAAWALREASEKEVPHAVLLFQTQTLSESNFRNHPTTPWYREDTSHALLRLSP